MGVVYKARDLKLDRPVALKFLAAHLTTLEGESDQIARERFKQEAKSASALDHPNIGTIYEVDETPDGQTFIAMAFYEGETIRKKVARGPLEIDQAVDSRGYERKELYKHPFVYEGRVLSWEEGVAKFTDRTGRPGPSTWEVGDYPESQDDFPVPA
jgi:serine/threonine-protein kinase